MTFQVLAGVCHEIPGNRVKIIAADARPMAGVTKKNPAGSARGILDPEDWNIPIDWAVRILSERDPIFLVDSPVDGKARQANPA